MPIVSIIGPKGGIGKTTLSINTSAALTQAMKTQNVGGQVCLMDLDLRLPTISDVLNSHPRKTFYDLFETLANKTYQVDFLQTLYRILVTFRDWKSGDIPEDNRQLWRSLALYQNLNPELFHFSGFEFGDAMHELFLHRGKIRIPQDLKILKPLLTRLDIEKFHEILEEHRANSRPIVEEYVHYVEEYGFSIIGGEVPILGKKSHRKRIHEPAFLVFFLEFLDEIFERFEYVILDTPAGGVGHLSSLMNSIDQVLLVFDMTNRIAIEGSIDALHSFIDYYEDFYDNYTQGRLTGPDKAYVNRLVATRGKQAVEDALGNKNLGLMFNRCRGMEEIGSCLDRMRDYLDTLDQYEKYKDKVHIVGMMPQNRIVNITNNRGALFYNKDRGLTAHMDQVAAGILSRNQACPTLANPNDDIIQYLKLNEKSGLAARISRIANVFN